MTTLYSCRSEINRAGGMVHRITKFDDDMNVEASYIVDGANCNCPAGERPSCRHRKMLPKFIARGAVNTFWLLDYERGGWVSSEIQCIDEASDVNWSEVLSESEIAEMSDGVERDNLTIAHEVTLPADATGEQVVETFVELLREGKHMTTSELMALPQYHGVSYREVDDLSKPKTIANAPLNRRGF